MWTCAKRRDTLPSCFSASIFICSTRSKRFARRLYMVNDSIRVHTEGLDRLRGWHQVEKHRRLREAETELGSCAGPLLHLAVRFRCQTRKTGSHHQMSIAGGGGWQDLTAVRKPNFQ